MNRHYSSKTAVWILCALFVLISAVVAVAKPVDSAQAQAPAQQPAAGSVTDTWAVQISPGTNPDQLALQMGAQNLGQIGALTGYYLFRIPGTDSELTAMADVFAANSQVVWFEQQVARQQTRRVFEDPVYLDQWHLINANVEPAWNAGFTGTGVNIAIVDDGLQHSHPDLSAQYKAALSHDYNGDAPLFAEDSDPEDAVGHQDYHGTASAGMAAADYNGNTLATSCGVGVAYDAGLSGLRLIAAPSTPYQIADALNFGMNPASLGADFNSIYSNSWGPADNMTEPLVGPGTVELAALQAGVTTGRNGKGSIYVWAAGNGLEFKDNVNYDGYANSRFTIAVGAVDDLGEQASYSEPGAAMLVTAPSTSDNRLGSSIVTTDLLGYHGYNFFGECTDGVYGGTSASAPIVSGVVALMLDANPNLGWRDVQNILARTAVKNDPTDTDWDANLNLAGVQNNGAGLHVNHKYGFGLVNAAAAVAMAADPFYKRLSNDVNFSSGVIVPDINNRNIPDNVLDGGVYDSVASVFDVTDEIKLEHVEVVFYSSENLNQVFPGTGGYRGDLRLVLVSPSGTESVLSEPHGDSAPDYTGWKFMTVRNWGESSLGTWTLKVTDEKGGGVSVFDSWELILHGTGTVKPIFPSSWAGSITVESDQDVVAVGRPHVGDQVMIYDGFSGGSTTMYVPMLFKNMWDGYNSALYIQNVNTNDYANITISFYNTNGDLSCTKMDTISPLSSKGYWIPSEDCLPTSWVGGVVITSDVGIVAVGRPHIGSEVTTYNGFSNGSLTMYVPMLFNQSFGGSYNSALYVQNVDPNFSANITIKYYDNDGNLSCTTNDVITPLSSRGYWVPSESCLPLGWVGGVVITSDVDIVAVGRPHIGSQITTYDGFSGGSLKMYVPMLFKQAYGIYNSALYVQNVDSGNTADITIEYFDSNGNLNCTINDTLAPLSSHGYWVPSESCLPVGWVGGVVVTSNRNIVAVGRPHLGTEVMTYDGFSGGSLANYVPMLFKNMWGSYNSAFYLQNLDPANPANVTVNFYDTSGNLNCIRKDVIPARASLGYWVPSVTCLP